LTAQVFAELIEAFRKGANTTLACEHVGVSRATFYKRIDKCKRWAAMVRQARECAVDRIELALHEKAKAGDTTAMIFLLKNLRPDVWRDRHELVAPPDIDDYRAVHADGAELVEFCGKAGA